MNREITRMTFVYRYPRPMLTVDAIVLLEESNQTPKVLLIKRRNDPYKGYWAFPGGFVDMDETAEHAASRELEEETGLSGINLKQFYTASKVDRDPRGRNISVIFYGFTDKENSKIEAADDALKAEWVSIKKLPALGFDHSEILEAFLKRYKEFK